MVLLKSAIRDWISDRNIELCVCVCVYVLFYLLLFCMLHYYEVILHALVVSYTITKYQLKFLVLYTSLLS